MLPLWCAGAWSWRPEVNAGCPLLLFTIFIYLFIFLLRSAGQGALGICTASVSPARGLQVCATTPGLFARIVGSKSKFSCLCGKHFADWATSILYMMASNLFYLKYRVISSCSVIKWVWKFCVYPRLAGIYVIPLFKHISIFQSCLCPGKTNKYLTAIVFGRLSASCQDGCIHQNI